MPGFKVDDYRKSLEHGGRKVHYYSLEAFEKDGHEAVSRMPVTVKILLESILRNFDGEMVTEEHLSRLSGWTENKGLEIPFSPARILMQDFTGVPAVVDLAVMRNALEDLGGDPSAINPIIPVDLVIDHSVQVDRFASVLALPHNANEEFRRNRERYELLRWASESFKNVSVVPPAAGICHQVNLEYLAKVVQIRSGELDLAIPDTLLGTDSHTTMINGLGVLGWGVGGIEAEAALLGQPVFLPVPQVIGYRMTGQLNEGVTATDLVLTVTQHLRKHGVVGKFVEFYGPGLVSVSLTDRATISNMCPEYGATAALFPVDEITMDYLRLTGRDSSLIDLVDCYTKTQGLFRSDSPVDYTEILELDLSSVEPSIAGPKRPQDRIRLSDSGKTFREFADKSGAKGDKALVRRQGCDVEMTDGAVIVAAITSCTNTSNPSVMVGAGLLAKKAVERGLRVPPFVKTSLAPGSRVVSRYLEQSGLQPYLDALGFHLVGFGCTTCIGNSGPLPPEVSHAVKEKNLIGAAVLSGNRNFEGRIHQEVKANYLASPPLVVAYALAGTVDIDLTSDPIGEDANGQPVYLSDIWPSQEEIRKVVASDVTSEQYKSEYENIYTGNETWNQVKPRGGVLYDWDPQSTYILKAPFFEDLTRDIPAIAPIKTARVLALLGESITTDHISPAGAISPRSPAARWLLERGVEQGEFNTFGSRRGNHEVMMRGTFGNIRIRNKLAPGTEGGYTRVFPDGKEMTIYEASEAYREAGVPLIVIAGRDYGMGSSRDWAAKGAALLGVRAVIAEGFERIHRSNLIGMGVLPLQFQERETDETLGLTGEETYDIEPVTDPGQVLVVRVTGEKTKEFRVTVRIDTPTEMVYYRNGGILHTVLRHLVE